MTGDGVGSRVSTLSHTGLEKNLPNVRVVE